MSFVDPTGHMFTMLAGNTYSTMPLDVFTNVNTVTTTSTVVVSSTTTVILTTRTTTTTTYHNGHVYTSSSSFGSRQVINSAPTTAHDVVLDYTGSNGQQTSYSGGCTPNTALPDQCTPNYKTEYFGGTLASAGVSLGLIGSGIFVTEFVAPAAFASGVGTPYSPYIAATGIGLVAGLVYTVNAGPNADPTDAAEEASHFTAATVVEFFCSFLGCD